MAFSIVRYKVQTLILVDREARTTGAGSVNPFASDPSVDGVIKGKTVDNASGNRRVRNSCDACRYVLEICDGATRELVDETRDGIEVERTCDPKASEAVGLRVADNEPSNAIRLLGCL